MTATRKGRVFVVTGRRSVELVLIALLSTALPGPIAAADLIFKISKVPNSPLAGTIWINEGQSGNRRRFRDVPASGTLMVSNYNCNATGAYFSASVTNPKLKLVDETQLEKDCNLGNIPFEFEEKKYASVLGRVISGEELQAVEVTADIEKLQQSLKVAYENDNTEASLKASSQISAMLRTMGYTGQANSYQTFHLDLAKTKVSGQTALVFDPKQNIYVLNDQDVKKIKRLQVNNGLTANGSVNWKTMEALGRVENPL